MLMVALAKLKGIKIVCFIFVNGFLVQVKSTRSIISLTHGVICMAVGHYVSISSHTAQIAYNLDFCFDASELIGLIGHTLSRSMSLWSVCMLHKSA